MVGVPNIYVPSDDVIDDVPALPGFDVSDAHYLTSDKAVNRFNKRAV